MVIKVGGVVVDKTEGKTLREETLKHDLAKIWLGSVRICFTWINEAEKKTFHYELDVSNHDSNR
jgi:hypothetical protein